MKEINNYILEKLKINKDSKLGDHLFAGLEIAPNNCIFRGGWYDKNGKMEFIDEVLYKPWKYDHWAIQDKSCWFSFNDLGWYFDNKKFDNDSGDIQCNTKVNGYRIPTFEEWQAILGTDRAGSTVNDKDNCHYSFIECNKIHGLLLFPDNEKIKGADIKCDIDNGKFSEITEDDLMKYIKAGCVFLEYLGDNIGHTDGIQYLYYHVGFWSSSEKNKDRARCVFLGSDPRGGNIYCKDTDGLTWAGKDKGGYCLRLVK